MDNLSAGLKFRAALDAEQPLQIAGCINAISAHMAKQTGFKAIYLSGGGVSAGSIGVPDLAITTLDDVLTDVRRITDVSDLPLLVDTDTGFGSNLNISRTVKSLIKFGAGAMHIEDQSLTKRCGHRPGKMLIDKRDMIGRIKAAVDARTDHNFVIMARTDALAPEGLQSALDRASCYVEAGADMIFPEAITTLSQYQQFAQTLNVPILANITEFGMTPLYTVKELASVGVSIILYPLSAFRAMNAAALNVFHTIRNEGTQQNVLETMQSREELYTLVDYHAQEQKLDMLTTEASLKNNE